jgi:tetratricopeptide (TPR) repeat protein
MQNAWVVASLFACVACSEPSPGEAVPSRSSPPAATPVAGGRPPLQARSFRFTSRPRRAEIARSAAPVSLTASDGTGLALVALRADAVVEGPLAFTQLHMTFENPEDRVIEGQFRITLAGGASVSRFAMKIDERWQEGEVVEIAAARRAYEDFLHRRQDPALLEQAPGNEFSARVFPIPARARKEIILSYSQELVSAEQPYTIPLRGLPSLGELSIRVLSGRAVVAEKHERDLVPADDFRAPLAPSQKSAGLRSGELAVVRVTPAVDPAPDEIDSLLVLVDTSASRALGFEEQAGTVEALIAGLASGAGDRPVMVAAFDQEVEAIYQGSARGYGAQASAKLMARRPLGASDLGAALRFAGQARQGGAPYRRVVVMSDGVATAGDLDAQPLRAAAKQLASVGVERLDALVVGGIRDQARLHALVTAGLARDGAVIDGGADVETIAARLTSRTRSGIAVAVEGASWFWPRTLDAVQAGDQALIYARVAGDRPLRVKLGGAAVELAAESVGTTAAPLIERALARAEIESLTAERDALEPSDKRRGQLAERIIDISTARRVLSPFTALLVLETEDDYARFGIDRKALADILVVDDAGLAVTRRTAAQLVIARPSERRPRQTRNDPAKRKALEQDESQGADKGDAEEEDLDGRPMAEPERKEEAKKATEDAPPPADAPAEPPAGAAGQVQEIPPPATGAEAGGAASGAAAGGPPADYPRAEPSPSRAGERRMNDSLSEGHMGRAAQEKRSQVDPYTGKFRDVMRLVRRKKMAEAVELAAAWHDDSPGDVMALIALGKALEARGEPRKAARAYGSLIDLFPQRADLRRFAGAELEHLSDAGALALAADTYARAAEQRADHPASHRLLAFALVRQGKHEEAFAALERGLAQDYPEGRFAGVLRILSEDLGLIAAAWTRAAPKRRAEIRARLKKAGGTPEDGPSIRFVLNWETDANDVDFHIHDGDGNHAFYSQPRLASGGDLYADVTTGYGPECFTIRGPRKQRAYPYRLEAHYYSRGPMGYGMGKLEIVEHDGAGNLRFEQRPFQIMQDNAFVDLGTVKR